MLEWMWDPRKDAANRRAHAGLSLADGISALQDPNALSRTDPHPEGDRWQTVGVAFGIVCLFVVHTEPITYEQGREIGRIISVRKAARQERRDYDTRGF